MAAEPDAAEDLAPRGTMRTIFAIGLGQILGWGSVFYLIAVIARPVAEETGWTYTIIISGHMFALLIAGLASPRVGRFIESFGGRGVLAFASVLIASGHVLLALSHHLALWYVAWGLLGLGMACGLYDAAFSTLGQIFGAKARPAITNVTLFGGLASTICWPLTAFMIAHAGWREACLAFAAIHLFLMLPAHLAFVPKVTGAQALSRQDARVDGEDPDAFSTLYLLLASLLVLAAAVAAIVSVHLIPCCRRAACRWPQLSQQVPCLAPRKWRHVSSSVSLVGVCMPSGHW